MRRRLELHAEASKKLLETFAGDPLNNSFQFLNDALFRLQTKNITKQQLFSFLFDFTHPPPPPFCAVACASVEGGGGVVAGRGWGFVPKRQKDNSIARN